MKNNNKTIWILIGVILLLLTVGFFGAQYYKAQLKEARQETRMGKIREGKLEKLNEGLYSKIIADTLNQRQMSKQIADLGIKVEGQAKMLQRLVLQPKPIDNKPIDNVVVTKDSVSVEDYYPSKENRFATYKNRISLKDSKGNADWKFEPLPVNIAMFQNDDTTWRAVVKVPEWMEVGALDITATPLEQMKPKNFGWLAGVGAGKEFTSQDTYVRLSGGLRYKKFYVILGGNSNVSADLSINYEF